MKTLLKTSLSLFLVFLMAASGCVIGFAEAKTPEFKIRFGQDNWEINTGGKVVISMPDMVQNNYHISCTEPGNITDIHYGADGSVTVTGVKFGKTKLIVSVTNENGEETDRNVLMLTIKPRFNRVGDGYNDENKSNIRNLIEYLTDLFRYFTGRLDYTTL